MRRWYMQAALTAGHLAISILVLRQAFAFLLRQPGIGGGSATLEGAVDLLVHLLNTAAAMGVLVAQSHTPSSGYLYGFLLLNSILWGHVLWMLLRWGSARWRVHPSGAA